MTVGHPGLIIFYLWVTELLLLPGIEAVPLEELVRINALVNKLLDASNSTGTVGRIGHTKPLARGVEHLTSSLALIDQLIHYPRNQILSLGIGLGLRRIKELLEILVAVFKVFRCEAPYIHAHWSGISNLHPLAVLVLVGNIAVGLTLNLGTLHTTCQQVLVILGTNATRYRTVVAQCVANAETDHGILAFAVLRQLRKELANHFEAVAVVEIITVDHAERLVDHLLGHHHSMVGTPRFGTALGNGISLRDLVETLEDELAGDMTLIFGKDLLAEILFEILADHPDDLAKTGLDGVIDTVVHDRLAVGAQTVQLFQTTITAAHTGSKQ